jgi:predicted outer membrane lipoprotein
MRLNQDTLEFSVGLLLGAAVGVLTALALHGSTPPRRRSWPSFFRR